MGLALWLAVANVILSVAAYVFRPKAKKSKIENNVQRQGVDQNLARLYGTRRMSMVITDSTTSLTNMSPDYIGASAGQIDPAYAPDIYSSWSWLGRQYDVSDNTAHTALYVQGPICLTGRLNATFNSTDDTIDTKVNNLNYDDESLMTYPDKMPASNAYAIYLNGGTRDGYAEAIPGFGKASDEWTNCIHACCFAWQRLTAKSGDRVTYNGIPQWSFLLESNKLYDPRGGSDTPNDRFSWTGFADNPALQLLDYLLDKDFGIGVAVSEIDMDSFKLMADICDVPISVYTADTTLLKNPERNPKNRVSGINDLDKVEQYLRITFGFNDAQVADWMARYQETYQARTRERTQVRQLMESNLTLETDEPLNENLQQILAALRGARLLKNQQGKWKVLPAWIVEEDITQEITGVSGTGPFTQNFAVPADALNMLVKKNDVVIPIGTITQELESDSDELDTVIISYKDADFDNATQTLTVNFNYGDAPIADITQKYVLEEPTIGPSSRIVFVPTASNPVITDDDWVVTTGVYVTSPSEDKNYNGANGSFKRYRQIPEFTPGITLAPGDSLIPTDVLTIEYLTVPGIELAAHIIADPMVMGLDYDAKYDDGGDVYVAGTNLPLIQVMNPASSGYASVTLDERLNQCTIKFPDELQDYKTNEVTWPDTKVISIIQTWNADDAYVENNKVWYSVDKQYYRATAANTGEIPPTSPNWTAWEPNIYSEYLYEDNYKALNYTESSNSITSRAHAVDYAEFIVRQSRSANTISYTLAPTAMMLEPNDLVQVTDPTLNLEDTGPSNRYWRVAQTKVNADATVEVRLTQYETEDYTYVSEDFADDKYVAELSPIPTATWADPPFVKFPMGTELGSGRLQWIAPDFGSIAGYMVKMATHRTWWEDAVYEVGSKVFSHATDSFYRAVTSNSGIDPSTDDGSNWVRTEDGFIELGGTDSTSMVITGLEYNKQYIFSVQVAVPTRGLGPPIFTSVNFVENLAPPLNFSWNSSIDTIKIEWDRGGFVEDPDNPGCIKHIAIDPTGAAFRVYVREIGWFLDVPRIGAKSISVVNWDAVTIYWGEEADPHFVYDEKYFGEDPTDLASYRPLLIDGRNVLRSVRTYDEAVRLGYLVPPVIASGEIKDYGTTGTNSFVLTGLKRGYAYQIWVKEIYPYDPTVFSDPGPLDDPHAAWCEPAACIEKEYACDAYISALVFSGSTALWPLDDDVAPYGRFFNTKSTGELANTFYEAVPALLSDQCNSDATAAQWTGSDNYAYLYPADQVITVTPAWNFSWSCLVDGYGRVAKIVMDQTNDIYVFIDYELDNSITIEFNDPSAAPANQSFNFPGVHPGNAHALLFTFDDTTHELNIYIDYAATPVITQGAVTTFVTLGDNSDSLIELGRDSSVTMSHAAYYSKVLGAEEIAQLKEGYERNDASYTDPDPICDEDKLNYCPIGSVGKGLLVQSAKNYNWVAVGYFQPTPPGENEYIYSVGNDDRAKERISEDHWFDTSRDLLPHIRNESNTGWREIPYNSHIARNFLTFPEAWATDGKVNLILNTDPPTPEVLMNADSDGVKRFGLYDNWSDLNDGNSRHFWDGTKWVRKVDTDVGTGDDGPDVIRNYFSDTTPSPGNYGDLWFDTSGGEPYPQAYWDNAAWTSIAFSADNVILAGADNPVVVDSGTSLTFFGSKQPYYDPKYRSGDPWELSSYALYDPSGVIDTSPGIEAFNNAVREGHVTAPLIYVYGEKDGDVLLVNDGSLSSTLYHWEGYAWVEGHYSGALRSGIGRDCLESAEDVCLSSGVYRAPEPPEEGEEIVTNPLFYPKTCDALDTVFDSVRAKHVIRGFNIDTFDAGPSGGKITNFGTYGGYSDYYTSFTSEGITELNTCDPITLVTSYGGSSFWGTNPRYDDNANEGLKECEHATVGLILYGATDSSYNAGTQFAGFVHFRGAGSSGWWATYNAITGNIFVEFPIPADLGTNRDLTITVNVGAAPPAGNPEWFHIGCTVRQTPSAVYLTGWGPGGTSSAVKTHFDGFPSETLKEAHEAFLSDYYSLVPGVPGRWTLDFDPRDYGDAAADRGPHFGRVAGGVGTGIGRPTVYCYSNPGALPASGIDAVTYALNRNLTP